MIQELEKPHSLLWTAPKNVRFSTKTFTQEEIKLMFDTIRSSNDYWKGHPNHYHKEGSALGEWGEFFKMRDICLIATIYYCALRPGEACGLAFQDVDFQNKKVFVSGKSNKTKKDRIIDLPKQLIPFFEEYLMFDKRFWKDSPYLFPSFMSPRISPQTFKLVFREKALKPAGLYCAIKPGEAPKNSTTKLYSLRKSRACELLGQTKDLFLVANVLGHSDIRVTNSYYSEVNSDYSDYMKKAMDGEVESLKKPSIEINQTNNINVQVLQQVIVQQSQQIQQLGEMVNKLLAKDN